MEFRMTTPDAADAFDILSPAVLEGILGSGFHVDSRTEKPVHHEYILLADPRLSLKLAAGGTAFDVKWLVSSAQDGALQDLAAVGKGKTGCPTDADLPARAAALESAVKAAATAATTEPDASALQLCAKEYTAAKLVAGDLVRVDTAKTNTTLRSGDVTVERIVFVARYYKGTEFLGERALRSSSVEGQVQEAVVQSLLQQAKKVHGDKVVLGAFNAMLSAFAP